MRKRLSVTERSNIVNSAAIREINGRLDWLEKLVKDMDRHVARECITKGNVTFREEALKKSLRIIEADVAELIRNETERLFSPDQIWWEKKIFLPADDETADLNFAAFIAYMRKKFKALPKECEEWSVLTAHTVN